MSPTVDLDGTGLRAGDVETIARGGAPVRVTDAGWERIAVAARPLGDGSVYGRTTGVGANKHADAAFGNGLRLLRSHACGAGAPVPADQARAMLAVRVNQLAAGGAGVHPRVVAALVEALNQGLTPPVRSIGAIGTGDLTALATTALCLLGERPWQGGTMPVVDIDDGDALALISSSAATIGAAALAWCDTDRLLRAMVTVAALSMDAVDASPEPFAEAVQAANPYPGQARVAAMVRALIVDRSQRRVQDSYAYRALPQVHGTAFDAADRLDAVLTVALNAAAENPLVASGRAVHNGNFHTAALAAAADGLCAALAQTAALSAARLASLVDPATTGLRAFLATGPQDSSGVMILEYVAHSALAELRGCAGGAVAAASGGALSMGAEEHASFATQSAARLATAADRAAVVVGCELVAAARAVRQRGGQLPGPLAAFASADDADRSLEADLDAAVALLPTLAD
ncbi:histidine ammonia-lyase [Asanoa ishikariensis]|uniref:Histidine ammonia-lyase n=1 Tax=Asanoa ishikariensis TaxID=137265 RepID=A0A1H3UL55_9ACTN|nr:aromatic amino acid lyase [Asanoa ishikariensis]GIF63337.1 histidine ammonia-lyase [Asanoa ishikariensis]SDZ62575.1 histidine ammonia-lyase [Asanoa ishikariensis]